MNISTSPTAALPDTLGVQWARALTDYEAKRRLFEDCPSGTDNAVSAALCDAWCSAMDHLVEDVRAPNVEAAIFKMELAKERWDGFTIPDVWLDGFAADMRHLLAPGVSPELGGLIERYETALRTYNETPGEGGPLEVAFHDALDALDGYTPRTPAEFFRAFAVRFRGGLLPHDEAMSVLVDLAEKFSIGLDHTPPVDPHMDWMRQRDELLGRYNAGEGEDDGPVIDEARAIEQRMVETPATGPSGILAKALLVIGACTLSGNGEAIAVFGEAKALGLIEWEA